MPAFWMKSLVSLFLGLWLRFCVGRVFEGWTPKLDVKINGEPTPDGVDGASGELRYMVYRMFQDF